MKAATTADVVRLVTEKEFQAQVVEYAKLNGWLVYHTYDSRHSEPGFPDMVMTREEAAIVVELKAVRGKLTADQEKWLSAFRRVPQLRDRVFVWRPGDWAEIERVLGPGGVR